MSAVLSNFEIYFVGLICFINNNHQYAEADLVFDEPTHKATVYIGASGQTILLATGNPPPNVPISFDLPRTTGPAADERSDSPIARLQALITPAGSQLNSNRPLSANVSLPDGTLSATVLLPGTFAPPQGPSFPRDTAQLTMLSCPTTATQVTVTVGILSTKVPASSYVVIGNMSGDHDACVENHFQRYLPITTGTAIAKLTGPKMTKAGAPAGANQAAALAAITGLPHGKLYPVQLFTLGQADCSSSQFP